MIIFWPDVKLVKKLAKKKTKTCCFRNMNDKNGRIIYDLKLIFTDARKIPSFFTIFARFFGKPIEIPGRRRALNIEI